MKKLGFGLMRLPVTDGTQEHIDQNASNQMVDLYLERGFTYFDTSYVYHNGASETAIREALVKRHDRGFLCAGVKISYFYHAIRRTGGYHFPGTAGQMRCRLFRLLPASQLKPLSLQN